MPHSLTLAQLQEQHGATIDTRASAFYNGWPQTLNGTSGHDDEDIPPGGEVIELSRWQ
jgi:hypothetical protein